MRNLTEIVRILKLLGIHRSFFSEEQPQIDLLLDAYKPFFAKLSQIHTALRAIGLNSEGEFIYENSKKELINAPDDHADILDAIQDLELDQIYYKQVLEVFNLLKFHAEFIVSPYNDPLLFLHFINFNHCAGAICKNISTSIKETLPNEESSLTFFRILSGRAWSESGKEEPALTQLENAGILFDFLWQNRNLTLCLYARQQILMKLAMAYHRFTIPHKIEKFIDFLKDPLSLDFFKKCFNAEWHFLLIQERERESSQKLFRFAQKTLTFIKDAKITYPDEWSLLERVITHEKDQLISMTQELLQVKTDFAIFLYDKIPELQILIGHYQTQCRLNSGSHDDKTAVDLYQRPIVRSPKIKRLNWLTLFVDLTPEETCSKPELKIKMDLQICLTC